VAVEGGNCFPVAVQTAIECAAAGGGVTVYIAHGVPAGQGPIAGIRHWHAWVEMEHPDYDFTLAVDRSNGQSAAMTQVEFYKMAQLDEDTVWRFTLEEALERMALLRHYGPWVYG